MAGHNPKSCLRQCDSGSDLEGNGGGPGPQASHQQGASQQTPQFLKPCNSIANPFLKSQIRHWAQASHQLNPALVRFRVKYLKKNDIEIGG